MLTLFAVIFGGILLGRLLRRRPLGALPHLISGIIWLLLFLLGVEVGGNPQVIGGLATLGVQALLVSLGALAGSILAARWLWLRIAKHAGPSSTQAADTPSASDPHAHPLKGSLTIVGFFVAGCITGLAGLLPEGIPSPRVSSYTLYALMGCVGITLGHDATLMRQIRRLDRRMALLPLATAAGTLLGALAAAPLVGLRPADGLAVGAGFGYYSLSSIFISDLRGIELGTVALLSNVIREIFTLLGAPFVARRFGPLAAISIGGATTFDTTLPIITRSTGAPYVVVAIFHGCALDFSVPFLVTLFCSL